MAMSEKLLSGATETCAYCSKKIYPGGACNLIKRKAIMLPAI